MSNDNDDGDVVNLHEGTTPRVCRLHERIVEAIDQHCRDSDVPVTNSEIIGTIEFVKAEIMGTLE